MGDKLRVGVIGLGWQGGSHLANFGAIDHAALTAICDRDTDRLEARAEECPNATPYRDYHELLQADDVDAVAIVLPDHLHREAAIEALGAGKHVLLEKPMALTVDDAEAVAAAAEEADGTFMLNLSNRWMHPFAAGKQLLDAGEVGAVKYVHARLSNRIEVPTVRLPWLQHSHLAHWIGVHRLDIACWYIGSDPVRVRAVHRAGVLQSQGFETIDFFQATVEFANGAVLNLDGSWILPPGHPNLVESRFYCLCENGLIDVDRMRSELAVSGPESFDLSTPGGGMVHGGMCGFTLEASRYFVRCCLMGEEPMVNAAHGVMLTKVLCAIVESANTDGAVIDLG